MGYVLEAESGGEDGWIVINEKSENWRWIDGR